jgi:CO/xanthine dehydrogenase FAD-binding subunit
MSVFVPTTLDEALVFLGAAPDTLVLAGGTDAMVELNSGHRSVHRVLAVNRIGELRSWTHDPAGRTLRIGGAVTWTELLTAPLDGFVPALAQAARTVGSPQIRAAGTIGGNVQTASPAGDGLPVLSALEAVVHLSSADGTRDVPFAEFMIGPKRTVRRPDELVVAVTVPVLDGYQGYSKVGVRNAMVIATAGVCLATDARQRSVRIALGSVGPVILRASAAEALVEQRADFASGAVADDVVAEAAELAADAARPIDDHRSTASYRRHAIRVLTARQLRRAFPRGGA